MPNKFTQAILNIPIDVLVGFTGNICVISTTNYTRQENNSSTL